MKLARRQEGSTMPARWTGDVWDWFDNFFRMGPGEVGIGLLPATDIEETQDSYVIKSELPGVDSKDVEVTLHDDMLIIRGEKRQEEEGTERGVYRAERRYGEFHRELRLPGSVDAGKIQAKCRNGVLTVTVPKSEMAKPKKIEIQSD